MDAQERAVEALLELGLTEYEARCFVALSRVPQGTAKDVSRIADIPRSRVYDSIERLQRRGLVNVQQSKPRQYQAVSKQIALDHLREEYRSRIDVVDQTIGEIESPSQDDGGTWEVADHEHVLSQVVTLIDTAEEDLFYLAADEALFETDVLEALRKAADRGVELTVEAPAELLDTVADRLPEARILENELVSNADLAASVGRIVLVDRETAIVSTRHDDDLPGVTNERALWSKGLDHGLVVTVQEMLLTWSDAFRETPPEA